MSPQRIRKALDAVAWELADAKTGKRISPQARRKVPAGEARALLAEKPKRNKFKVRIDAKGKAARMMLMDGKPTVFDSLGEMNRWCELKLLEKAGKIEGLERQRTLSLMIPMACVRNGELYRTPGITWRADFSYVEKGKWIVEDFKGAEPDAWKMKLELILHNMTFDVLRITHENGTRDHYMR